MTELRNPVKPFCQYRINLDDTIVSEDDSQAEDYHKIETTDCINNNHLCWKQVSTLQEVKSIAERTHLVRFRSKELINVLKPKNTECPKICSLHIIVIWG